MLRETEQVLCVCNLEYALRENPHLLDLPGLRS